MTTNSNTSANRVTEQPDHNNEMASIERRIRSRHTRAFVTAATVDLLAEKTLGIMGERRMVKCHRYLDRAGGRVELALGLRVDHTAYRPINHRPGLGLGVHLRSPSPARRLLDGFSFHVGCGDDTEDQVAHLYHHPEREWLGERRDITLVELDGWPGSPSTQDTIRIEFWNEHGVGQETVIVFDEIDLINELGWDVKGDKLRQMHLDDDFCDTTGLHFENPAHRERDHHTCQRRQATRAENLTVLALLDGAAE